MTSFTDLLAPVPGLDPAAIQHRAQQLLPELVRRSPMAWIVPGSFPNGTGRKLLIGVAVWNRYDLNLLDRICDALASGAASKAAVAVFDLNALPSTGDVDRLIPGVSPVVQTPAVGFWEAGTFKEGASGFFGRQLVARVLGFDESSVHPTPLATAK